MTRLLHIETSTKMCSVAISENGVVKTYRNFQGEGFAHSEKLTLLISEVCAESEINLNQLDAISVSGGPGSYTGLRIGVSTAKGLCYSLNIPLLAIDSVRCLALWAKDNYPDFTGYFCPMIDARRMEVFSAIYTADLVEIKSISADVLDEESYAISLKGQQVILVGDAVSKCKELWKNRSEFIFSDLEADARGQAKEAYRLTQEKAFVNTAYYEPYYLKDFIAGVKKTS